MRATNVQQRPTSNDLRTASGGLRQALAGCVRAASDAPRAAFPGAHVSTKLAQHNKPMVATAHAGLDRKSQSPGRLHIGWPLCSQRNSLAAIAGLALASVPRVAFAEVSDKCTSVEEHWIFALPMAALLLLTPRWRWWTAFPLALMLVVLVQSTMEFPSEPTFGAALLEEQGWSYFASLWASDFVMIVALAIGGYLGWQKRMQMGESIPDLTLDRLDTSKQFRASDHDR